MSNVLKREDKVDGHVSELMKQFSARCGTMFDLAPWMQWTAFDIAMDAAFSSPLGLIKSRKDIGGLIHLLLTLLTGVGIIALFPSIVRFMYLPCLFPYVAPKISDKKGPGALYSLARTQVNRRSEVKDVETHNDILQWLIDHENKGGERLSKIQLEQEPLAPVLAGSDTTATVLRTIILFLSTNRRVLDRLRREIDAADDAVLLSTPPKCLEIKQHVPYMAGVMKEALRLYPVLGSPAFREIPKDGATISGYHLPPYTEIGICHYAMGRNTTTFGEDSDRFRPERWTEDVDPATKKLREKGDVGFGNGGMVCTGRNLATLEVWKIATQMFREFEIEVVDPVQPWQEKDSLAMLIWDFRVRFEPRQKNVSVR
jgi:cytochrome P450